MSTIAKALPVVMEHEIGSRWQTGGYTNDPADPGGPTKYGISFRYLKDDLAGVYDDVGHLAGDIDGDGDVDVNDVKALTYEEAVNIYTLRWWKRFGYERIIDQQCATKVFDCAINMGALRAHLVACQTLADCGYRIAEDPPPGVALIVKQLGDLAVNAINSCESREFLMTYCDRMKARYVTLATNNPKLQRFLNGWLERARWPFVNGGYVS